MFYAITCIIDSIPHLVTVDTGLVGVIVFKNSLKEIGMYDNKLSRSLMQNDSRISDIIIN